MRIHISHRPRLRATLAQKWKPFALLSFMLLTAFSFQNFIFVSQEPVKNISLPQDKIFIVSGKIIAAKVFETSDGPFNVIKGENEKAFKLEYLNALDTSGKDCMALAATAFESKQKFELTGILAMPGHGDYVFQKIINCDIRPAIQVPPSSPTLSKRET